jgi:hypothetical protein
MSNVGGGPKSNKVINVGVRAGAPSTNKISAAGVGQMGAATHFQKSPIVSGTAKQVPLGNEVAGNVGGGGPGTGRTVYGSGSQQGLKPTMPMPRGRGILNNE